jgi:VCBS repeat-containing protein
LTYTVSATDDDGSPLSDTETVVVTITGTNDGPIAVVDTNSALEAGGVNNGSLGVNPSGNVFDNDTDVDVVDTKTVIGVAPGSVSSSVGSVSSVVNGSFGSILIAANGSYTYNVDNSNPTVQSLRTNTDTLQDVFTYTMRDTDGVTSTTQITITIHGANDTPFDIVGGGLNVDENATFGTVVGSVLGQDLDSGDSFTYNLLDSAGGRFAIDNAGQITVANGSLLDREEDVAHTITVEVVDASGATFSKNFVIAINDLDEFDVTVPVDSDAASNVVLENASNGTTVGVVAFALDEDDTTNIVTYSLEDDAEGRFAIDANTGLVTVADGSQLDYEVETQHEIVVRATSVDGSSATRSFVIQLNDVNEFDVTSPIFDLDSASDFVAENSAIGTSVGIRAYAYDLDGSTNIVTYTLDDDADGRFAIDTNTGEVTVAGAIDREEDASYDITIRATSEDLSTSTRVMTIAIGDVDEFDVTAPVDTLLAINQVHENLAAGTAIGLATFSFDADATDNIIAYSLTNDAGGRFAIDAVSGLVTTAAMLDFEAQSNWGITVQALSEDGSSAMSNFTVAVLNVFERPVGIAEQYVTSYIDDLVLTGTGMLGNDFDPDGDAISAVLVSGPGRGSLVSFLASGGLRYTPERGFLGAVEIVYQAFDGMFLSDAVTVTIYVVIPDNLPSNDSSSGNDSGSSGQISTNTISTEAILAAVPPVEAAPTLASPTVPVSATVAPAEQVAYVADVTEVERAAFQASGASIRMSDMGRWHSSRAGHFEIHTHRASDAVATDRVHGYDGPANHLNDMSNHQISMDSVLIKTVLGTGIILWIAQGAQLAATLISVSPAWMHFDPLSMMPSLDDKRAKKEELTAGEKLFDK